MVDQRVRGVLDWDESYMRLAEDIAHFRSKDPSTQVGAFIVGRDHKPLSLGYNGTPHGWDDRDFPWGKTSSSNLDTKYKFVVHAERNAILNAPGGVTSLRDSTLYTTLFPCSECAKDIAQTGIREVVFREYRESEDADASKMILSHAGITWRSIGDYENA
jgi:dCMP deaminase